MTDLELYCSLIKSMNYEIEYIKEGINVPEELRVKDYLEGYLKGINVTLAEAWRLLDIVGVKDEEDN